MTYLLAEEVKWGVFLVWLLITKLLIYRGDNTSVYLKNNDNDWQLHFWHDTNL